ncbi:hypothetical protein BHM03_00052534 [Ensete ventricosum]|nr:hypothetical protein BHM03_00052534 [Ensete ventricosum]
MTWVLLASRLECDVEVFVMRRPLLDLRSCIGLARQGAVTAQGGPSEDDIDLLLDRTLRLGRRVSRGSAIEE